MMSLANFRHADTNSGKKVGDLKTFWKKYASLQKLGKWGKFEPKNGIFGV